MRQLRRTAVIASVAAAGLLLGACGSKRSDSTSPGATGSNGSSTTASNFTGCMVTDTGGIDDKSFNAAAWQGMQMAQKNGKAKSSYVQSKAETDYATNLKSLQAQSCKVIVTVGGLMADATKAAATADPKGHYVEVDSGGNGTNLKGLQFNTAQAAFQAGYLAAAYSKTGKVATYGGLKILPVKIYMDGFQEGIAYYNTTKSKNVQLLGWDEKAQNGSFAGSFTDQNKGKQLATNFIAQGADVIFPVAGGVGLGSAGVAQSTGKAVIIWVDTDGFVSAPQYASVLLTTVEKKMADAVDLAVEAAADGKFDPKDYIGTLDNGGVSLSSFHDFDSKVGATLKAELDGIKADIVSGKIKLTSSAQPKAS